MKNLYIIDGLSFAYRAFYAIGPLSTRLGQPTNAVYGVTRMLNKLIDKYSPEYISVAFDTGKATFRHEQYAGYKAHRDPMPDEMISQLPWIKKLISAYNIPLIEMDGFEADDIIATMAVNAEKNGFKVYIITSDKDMMQLVNDDIKIINPSKDDVVIDSVKVQEKFGVGPEKIIEFLALTGDSSDNIPGVPGIGEKTAAKFINQFGSVDALLNHLSEIPERLRKNIEEHKRQLLDNFNLVAIKKDMDIPVSIEDCIAKKPNTEALKEIFRDLEFNALLKEILERDSSLAFKDQIVIESKEQWDHIFSEMRYADSLCVTGGGVAYEKDSNIKSMLIADGKNELWKDVGILLEDASKTKFSNDIKSLIRRGFKVNGKIFDTVIAEGLLETRPSTDEEMTAAKIYSTVPGLEEKLIREGLLDLYNNIEMPLIRVLGDMESAGIKIDVQLLKKLSTETDKEVKILSEKIYKLAGEEFNINSPKQLEHILFEKLNLPKGRRTKTGFSTDVDVLESLAKHHELPQYLLEYRQLSKLKGTYIDPLPEMVDANDRLHTTFNQIGAATGRFSSSNPNLQNIPIRTELGKQIRRAFKPESEKFVFLGADYSQIELRMLAHLSGDEALIKSFKEDADIHASTAREIFGVFVVSDDMRRQAKVVNFGVLYGMGAKSMAGDLGISVQDAQRFIDAYFMRYAKVKEYIDDELDMARKQGYVVTMFGRKRHIPELQSSRPQVEAFGRRMAINTPVQGSAADIMKMAMINLHKKIIEKRYPAKMLLQIHDELILEMPEDAAGEVSKCVKEEMENVVKLKVPLKVDIKIGRSWADL